MPDYRIDDSLVQFISGVTADGQVAGHAYQTWTGGNDPYSATYSDVSAVRKWGAATPGTPATVTYGFDAASHWTTTEQTAFVAAMHLWQAEAGITFVAAGAGGTPQITITRSHDGQAEGFLTGSSVPVGAATLGTAVRGGVAIDTGVAGFGPIGAGFALAGGYPWTTIEHELGHALGLGHPGAYDGNDVQPWQNGSNDTRALSIMSYFDPSRSSYGYDWPEADGTQGKPVTPQILDIAALQRLYGAPPASPLGTGTVFGFNSTVPGDLRPFFDFSVNTRPIVTLFATGASTLDLSGFTAASVGSLHDGVGSYLSAGGLHQNIAIAVGTRIDTVLLGPGDDQIGGNDDAGNVIMGGAGADHLGGGAGNDHLYGYGLGASPDDGADWLGGGDGHDYLQGNGGADTLDGGNGDDRLFGGAGDDLILGGNGNNRINGNRGNDTVYARGGDDYVRGGQGDDVLVGHVVAGDLGDDRVEASSATAQLMGGDGADLFVIMNREGWYATKGPDAFRVPELTDFQGGVDHIHLDMAKPTQIITLAPQADLAQAAQAAAALIGTGSYYEGLFTTLVDMQVGGDTAIFFLEPGVGMAGLRIDDMAVDRVSAADFV